MDFSVEKKPALKVSIYGQEFSVSKPTVDQVKEYREKMKSENFDDIESSKEFLVGLGMSYDVLGSMEAEDYSGLIEFLINPKKK
jgi:hypothetical protein